MKALLPIDGSRASEMTLEWATSFLNPNTKVYLLHVIDPRLGTPFDEIVEEFLQKAKAIFTQKEFTFVYTDKEFGVPVDAICQYADDRDIPIIIIGAQGKSDIGKLLMGSVSSGVFKQASQQVLILNNKPRASITMNLDNFSASQHPLN